MSRLVILTRPELGPGFQLAGVEVSTAREPGEANARIRAWLEEEETLLIAVEDGVLDQVEPALLNRLEASRSKFLLSIPGGEPMRVEATRRRRFADMIQEAIGFQIRFEAEEEELFR